MRKDHSTTGAGDGRVPEDGSSARQPSAGEPSGDAYGELSDREFLRAALKRVGLEGQGAVAFADAAMVLGSLSQGRGVSQAEVGFKGESARAADAQGKGSRPRPDAAPGSMEDHLHRADQALTAVEAIASCSARLDAALVVATREQTTAVGSALLAQNDIADPGELSPTALTRWRGRAKRRSRSELVPAIGWTDGEARHLVGLSVAPVAFSVPVVTQMSRGWLPWRLARGLWRACESLDAADAAHVATVMCADDPTTCVPERLTPDGDPVHGPWEHRAFWTALAREVAKVTGADDADPEDAAAARAAREAAYAGRGVHARVDEDGTGALTLITSAFWVGAIKDRLDQAARTARAAGDERTLDQLQADIARTLLAHATLGFADMPDLPGPDQTSTADQTGEAGSAGAAGTGGAGPSVEDLLRAGWTPELVQALSGLPPAVLQVIVPLIGLHDPATADTLPTVARPATRPDPNTHPDDAAVGPSEEDDPPEEDSGAGEDSQGPGHTGKPGCPSCTPSRRTHHDEVDDGAVDADHSNSDDPHRDAAADADRPDGQDSSAHDLQGSYAQDPGQDCDDDHSERQQDCAGGAAGGDGDGEAGDGSGHRGPGRRARRLWVGEVLGAFGMFVSPAQVRELALSPGTTMARLLVDPADGRCVERSIATYRMDAAMRAQLLAADVTCRAPACQHTGKNCQVDHVQEYGTPDGHTSEANGQLLHTGHHESKTAKAWDAELAANRDITWTSLLGRIYQTRAWDYRRYVTLLVDAVDAVRSAPPEDQEDELNRQVYLALTHRALDDRLNTGEDDLEPEIDTTRPWPGIRLTHRDPRTGERVPGPSNGALTEVLTRRATHHTPSADASERAEGSDDTVGDRNGERPEGPGTTDGKQPEARPVQPDESVQTHEDDPSEENDPSGKDDQTHENDQADEEQAQEEVSCATCGEAHPRKVGRYDYHAITPPPGTPHKTWAQHILDRLAMGDDCPPF